MTHLSERSPTPPLTSCRLTEQLHGRHPKLQTTDLQPPPAQRQFQVSAMGPFYNFQTAVERTNSLNRTNAAPVVLRIPSVKGVRHANHCIQLQTHSCLPQPSATTALAKHATTLCTRPSAPSGGVASGQQPKAFKADGPRPIGNG